MEFGLGQALLLLAEGRKVTETICVVRRLIWRNAEYTHDTENYFLKLFVFKDQLCVYVC